jgi:hypothetical protein
MLKEARSSQDLNLGFFSIELKPKYVMQLVTVTSLTCNRVANLWPCLSLTSFCDTFKPEIHFYLSFLTLGQHKSIFFQTISIQSFVLQKMARINPLFSFSGSVFKFWWQFHQPFAYTFAIKFVIQFQQQNRTKLYQCSELEVLAFFYTVQFLHM